MEASTQEAGADVNENYLFAYAGHLEDGGLMSQSSTLGKMGNPCHKAHLLGRWGSHVTKPISTFLEAEVFIMRERGT